MKFNNKTLFIIIGIIAIAAVVYFVFNKKNSKKIEINTKTQNIPSFKHSSKVDIPSEPSFKPSEPSFKNKDMKIIGRKGYEDMKNKSIILKEILPGNSNYNFADFKKEIIL